MKKILIPIDSSEFSEKAIEKGKEFAQAFGSEIILLHVIENGLTYSSYEVYRIKELEDNYLEALREGGKELLEKTKQILSCTAGITVKTIMLEGSASHEIVEYANNNDIDLVIMGSNGLSGFQRFLGSVTNRVLHHIDKPILVIK